MHAVAWDGNSSVAAKLLGKRKSPRMKMDQQGAGSDRSILILTAINHLLLKLAEETLISVASVLLSR